MVELWVVTPEAWRTWRELRLAALAEAPYAFTSRLADWQGEGDREDRWRERLEIPQGSFYVALYRMEHRGLIVGEWGESENNRRAKFYKLTAAGRKQLKDETSKWAEMADVVGSILDATPEAL